MPLDLSSACQKLDRALLHLHALGDEMAALDLMARTQMTVADEEVYPHPRGFRHVFYVGGVTPTGPAVPLIAGDYIQNLRAALDHLAWELVRKGTEWPPRSLTAIQFPIYSVNRSRDKTKRTFSNRIAKELPGISDAQRALIDGYQPYHRGKRHLATLAHFSNQDKHRFITPVRRLTGRVSPTWLEPTHGGSILGWNILLEDGRRVSRRTPFLEVIVDKADTEVKMHSYVTIPVTLQERAGRLHRIPDLEQVGEVVAEIVGESARRWGRMDDALACVDWIVRARRDLGL